MRNLIACALLFSALTLAGEQTHAQAPADYESWPVLKNPFPSTGGGGVLIDEYNPVASNGKCRTDFVAIVEGKRYFNEVEFDAVAVQDGILCKNGKWRAKDGSAEGTTPFEVFIKNGVVRMKP